MDAWLCSTNRDFWIELPVERRRCGTCGMTFSTSYPGISPRSVATDAFQQWVAQSCIGTSIQAVARMLNLPYTTVERWFIPMPFLPIE